MKMSRLISIVLLGVTLIAANPIYAQRGGGGRSGGSSSRSSRSSGSSFSSSRGSSSSSRSSSFSSSSSRSSSSASRSSSSFSSSSSRSSSSASRSGSSSSRSSYSSPASRSTSSSESFGSSTGLRSSGSASGGSSDRLLGTRSTSASSRTGSIPAQMRGSQADTRSGAVSAGRRADAGRSTSTQAGAGRPSGIAPVASGSGRHPHYNPYYGDPRYRQIYWDPFPPRPYYWPGFWVYCHGYWFDYHVTDMVVVRRYLHETYNMELVTYAIGGDYMYALIKDPDGHTYLQVYDKNDKLLAEQQVSRKYIKMEIDSKNGGCWIMKKRDKDALLFLYLDGQLLIYEAER